LKIIKDEKKRALLSVYKILSKYEKKLASYQ
jgi:hypothetical protein